MLFQSHRLYLFPVLSGFLFDDISFFSREIRSNIIRNQKCFTGLYIDFQVTTERAAFSACYRLPTSLKRAGKDLIDFGISFGLNRFQAARVFGIFERGGRIRIKAFDVWIRFILPNSFIHPNWGVTGWAVESRFLLGPFRL